MTFPRPDRREFLRYSGALPFASAFAPFALQTAAAGAASAAPAASYRALVCVFLTGGNDGANTVLATDTESWAHYTLARSTGVDPIALMPVGAAPTPIGQISPITGRRAQLNSPESWGGVLPITPSNPQPIPGGASGAARSFALHPFLGPLKTLFDQGRLAILANVGPLTAPITKAQFLAGNVPTPSPLFSHNDQQSVWQSGGDEGAKIGWGGGFADRLATSNGANSLFTSISPAGGAVFLAGRSVGQYVVNTGATPASPIAAIQYKTLFGSSIAPSIISDMIQDTGFTSAVANDHAAVVARSNGAAAKINAAVAQGTPTTVLAPPNYVNPFTGATQVNSLAVQLQSVARLIAAAPQLGLNRQVFFVNLGGFDTHFSQNTTQPDLLGQLAQALAYFDSALSNIGGVDLRANVTTFTASDFGRTFTTNGSGTDHGWGSHHFIMGGSVKGGAIYGQFPTLGVDSGSFVNPDMAGNILIPTTAVDQYAATLGAWFGVSQTDLSAIFPNLGNFPTANLVFV